jgi:monoamine oxidase
MQVIDKNFKKMYDVIIIGGGLSGLTAAYQLQKQNISIKILEAKSRLGGRIETIFGQNQTPMEMGATWFGKKHRNLLGLLSDLSIPFFEQHTEGIALFETLSFEPPQQYFVPSNTHSAFRVQGGTGQIITALQNKIGLQNIVLNCQITQIEEQIDGLKISDSEGNTYFSKKTILALPPKLAENSIMFSPKLPDELLKIMQHTQTWMSGSIKFSVEYKTAFWLDNKFSGSVFSQSGLANEIYDHSHFKDGKFALKGFLNSSALHFSKAERQAKVIAQLTHYFGNAAQEFLSYNDKIWNDAFVDVDGPFLPAHHNNGRPQYAKSYFNDNLFFAGTETSPAFGGYMDGAIIAANATAERVLVSIKK